MTNAVKKKFVVITMILLIGVSAVFAGVYSWIAFEHSKTETRNIMYVMLDAVCEIENNGKMEDGAFLLEYADEDWPITKLVVSEDKKILYRKVFGGTGEDELSDYSIEDIISSDEGEWLSGEYVFCSTRLNDGNSLYLVANYVDENAQRLTLVRMVFAFIFGILLLAGITLYLSRFVTKPAEEALEREKRFVADASHELKTPLSAIAVNAQILEKKDGSSQQVQSILAETGRMSKMIEKLLTLSYLDAMKSDMSQRVDLSLMANEIALTYESVAFEKNITVTYEIEDNIIVKGNHDELYQLIVILVDNAIKNTPESGEIRILLSKNPAAELKVENTGKGISYEDLPHIFERFYSTGTSREDSSFGLGLAIAKAITDNHHGSIKAESDEGGRTCFTVRLRN